MLFRKKLRDGGLQSNQVLPPSTLSYIEDFARARLQRGLDPDGYSANVVAFYSCRQSNPSVFDRELTTLALENGDWAILGGIMVMWDLNTGPSDIDRQSWDRLAPLARDALSRCSIPNAMVPMYLL